MSRTPKPSRPDHAQRGQGSRLRAGTSPLFFRHPPIPADCRQDLGNQCCPRNFLKTKEQCRSINRRWLRALFSPISRQFLPGVRIGWLPRPRGDRGLHLFACSGIRPLGRGFNRLRGIYARDHVRERQRFRFGAHPEGPGCGGAGIQACGACYRRPRSRRALRRRPQQAPKHRTQCRRRLTSDPVRDNAPPSLSRKLIEPT